MGWNCSNISSLIKTKSKQCGNLLTGYFMDNNIMNIHLFATLLAVTFIAGGVLVAYIAAKNTENKNK